MFLKQRWLVLSAISIGLAIFSMQLQTRAAHPLPLDEAVAEFQQRQVEFETLEQPRLSHGRAVTAIKLTRFRADQTFALAARGAITSQAFDVQLQRGARYACDFQFRPAHKPTRDGFTGVCRDRPKLIQPAAQHLAGISGMREQFMKSLNGVTTDSAGLVAGLAIGDTSKLGAGLLDDMKTVSLTHLTAVSGANCAIVVALVYFLLKRFGARRLLRTILAMVSLVAYVLLVGAQPSVLRSAVMAAAVLAASALGRSVAPSSALALSVLILLVADPWLAIDYGFALSVLATLGLLLLTQPMTDRLKNHLPTWLAISISVAVSAQLFCLPVLLQLQGGLSSYSLPANLLAEPLVAPITVLGILACVVAVPLPWLAAGLSWLASIAAWCISQVAHSFASYPAATFSWFPGLAGLLLSIVLILSVTIFFKSRSIGNRSLAMLVVAAIVVATFSTVAVKNIRSAGWPLTTWQIVNCDVGQGDALVLRSEERIAVIDVGPEDKLIDACLDRLAISRIDLLVLTHFDMDHIGGLSGATSGRQVGTALVSSFADNRWGASQAMQQLRSSNVSVVAAGVGYQGQLGQFRFQVLNPSESSDDSNDGSLVIFWQGQQFNLLTMADIGERGQMRIAADLSRWWGRGFSVPLVLKVSHHGSADQYPELIEALRPQLSIISVGQGNSYGHPTQRTLQLLKRISSTVLRTDTQGAVSVGFSPNGLSYSTAGAG